MSDLRCAIIGIGPNTPQKGGVNAIAYAHAWAIRNTAGTALVAGCARSQGNRDGFVREFPGVTMYSDYRAMLAAEKPQLVSICAFPRDREAMVNAALDAGATHLWVEKPLAVSTASARRMLEAAAKRGASLVVNHQRRYAQCATWMREAVVQGRIGTVIQATVTQPCPGILDFGSHLVDAAISALPGDQPVRAFGAATLTGKRYLLDLPQDDQLVGTVHFASGARLVLESGSVQPSRSPLIRIDGSHGFIELHVGVPAGAASVYRARYRDGSQVENPSMIEHFHHDNHRFNLFYDRLLPDWLAAAAAKRACTVDGAEALRGLDCMLGLLHSAAQRRMIDLPLINDDCPLDLLAK
jgi:UDP-N-acetylglucosamine 3-dehydrogenase